MLIYYPLCALYFFIMFPIYGYIAGGKKGFFSLKSLIKPALTSLATQSSIATLPVNLEAAEEIGVPKDIREIVLPIGATAHMDGTVFSSILKISFLFGIFGVPFTGVGTYVSALLLSVAGGVVMSGVPGGGLIGEMLIVILIRLGLFIIEYALYHNVSFDPHCLYGALLSGILWPWLVLLLRSVRYRIRLY